MPPLYSSVRLPASEAMPPPPPLAGQHTAHVLAEVLGLSQDDVKEPQQRGVVG
jgi:crotonobetainyl-CoA:carnitine CoA-transferase CaiB-like acyl-CoA transferase